MFRLSVFVNILNQQHPNISFTYRFEDNNSLPFFTVLITHSDNGFPTNLNRKKTLTGQYMDFNNTLSPIHYKMNLITVLIYHFFTIFYHMSYFTYKFVILNVSFSTIIIKNLLDKQ